MNSDNGHKDGRSDGLQSQEPLDDELFSAYVDGELTGPELARVESRLRQDAEARRWTAELRTLSSRVQSLPRGQFAPDLREQVLRRVKQEQPSSEAKPSVDLAPPWGDESHGLLRRWAWSGLAIAAVLLLMFWQAGQPEGEKQVADAQPERGARSKEQGVRNEERETKDEGRGSRIEDRGTRSEKQWGRIEGELAAQPVPSIASAKVSEDLPASGARTVRENSFESFGLARKTNDRSPAQAGVRGRPESNRAARPTRSKQAVSSRAEPDLVVQVVMHDAQRDRQRFRQLLTEHGMKPRRADVSHQMTDALSEGAVKGSLERQAARDRAKGAFSEELLDTVVVEMLPGQLRGLLQAFRTEPEWHATVVRISPEGDSQAGSPDLDAPGVAGAYGKKRVDVPERLRLPKDLAETPRRPVRVRFELRVTKPNEESGEAPDNTRTPAAHG